MVETGVMPIRYGEIIPQSVDDEDYSFIESLRIPTTSGMIFGSLRLQLDRWSIAIGLIIEDQSCQKKSLRKIEDTEKLNEATSVSKQSR